MALIRQARNQLDWPDWFFQRSRLLDWPERWSEMLETAELRVEEFQEDGTMVVRAEVPEMRIPIKDPSAGTKKIPITRR